jgi:transposase
MTGPAPMAGHQGRNLLTALDKLARARRFNSLIYMAGEGMSDREAANAITTGADMVEGLIRDAEAILRAGKDAPAAA